MVKYENFFHSLQKYMDYILIDNDSALEQFYNDHKDIPWFGFDTEFVGEKRYYTLLCLIQVISTKGIFLIDVVKLKNINVFLQLIQDEQIVKITHAGENDYRVLNMLYGTIPKNIFDTQLAVGFLSHTYPMSFQKLVEKELDIRLPKGYSVTDWEARPFSPKQLKYAINDVLYLPDLWNTLTEKLIELGRIEWAREEMNKWESTSYYIVDPNKEAINNGIMPNITLKEQVFLLRLYLWRRHEAEAKNYSKEMILPVKLMPIIVKNINEGKAALMQNRLIPDKLLFTNWDTFNALYNNKITEQERDILKQIPIGEEETPDQVFTTEMLYLFLKQTCINNNIAPSLLINKSGLRDTPDNKILVAQTLGHGWRRALLGEDLLTWINAHGKIDFKITEKSCILNMDI